MIASAHVLAAFTAEAATPTDRLMVTRLEQTILALRIARRVPGDVGARLADEANAWIDSRRPGTPFGLDALCARFGVDPSWLRATLRG
jgi:hypothetical protein